MTAARVATDKLNRRLLDMAVRGDRPRCSDPIDHNLWTSDDQRDRQIAVVWCAAFTGAKYTEEMSSARRSCVST